MKKSSVKKNYIYNMLYQLLLIILPIITTPYIARRLGATGNGTYGYTVSIVTYFILFGSLGISMYGNREIAYNQKNKDKRSKVFWELAIIKIITMLISSVIYYFIFCVSGKYSIYYKILLFELLSNMLDISWFYQGMEDFKRIVIRNFIIRISGVICIFLFIKTADDLYKYFLISTLGSLLGSLSLWLGIWKYIEKPKNLKIFHHLPLVIALFIPQIAVQVYTVLDKTMIGSILNNMTEVGYYEQAQKIVKILLTVITAIGTVMMPRIANCYAEGDNKKIKEYMMKTFRFVFLLSFPLMFGIIAVSNCFVPFFFGDGYDKVPGLMSILSIIIVFISLSSVIGTQYLLSIKKQKEFTISVVVGAIVNCILNLILIQQYKSYGAAIATVIAELAVTSCQIYFIRKDFNVFDIFKLSIKYIISSVIMFACCFAIGLIIDNNLLCLIIQSGVGAVIYFSILLIIKDQFLYDLLYNNILSKFKIGKNVKSVN